MSAMSSVKATAVASGMHHADAVLSPEGSAPFGAALAPAATLSMVARISGALSLVDAALADRAAAHDSAAATLRRLIERARVAQGS